MELPKNLTAIETHPIQKLLDVAKKAVERKTADSQILDVDAEERIPKLELGGTS